MSLGKQAKILNSAQQKTVLLHLETTTYPLRNKLIFLLSAHGGLRSKEIASLQWKMVTNATGTLLKQIALTNEASKGNSGRIIWISNELYAAFNAYLNSLSDYPKPQDYIIQMQRAKQTSPQVITNWFWQLYRSLGFDGASSHSGRRTAITRWGKNISKAGGSLRDVQMLAGHSSLQMTQRYIEQDVEAQRKVVNC
jgi:integrase